MPLLHRQRLTASAALAPPQPGMYLVRVRIFGGTTPGTLAIRYNGTANAHFPTPSDGTTGYAEYETNWKITGTSVPAGSIVFNGGIAVAELVYSTQPNGKGKAIESFRAIRFARTDVGAVTADVTVSYDEAPARPLFVHPATSASRGRATFPATGALQFTMESAPSSWSAELGTAPELSQTNDLTLSVITDAAATSQYVVYY